MNFRPIDVINGMLNFNKRIMSAGSPEDGVSYTMKEFRQKLFFTRISYENLQELFQRWSVAYNKGDYLAIVERYLSNMITFLTGLRSITNYTYTRKDDRIPEIIMGLDPHSYLEMDLCRPEFPFEHKEVYYITLRKGCPLIHRINNRKIFYDKITNALLDARILCKVDDAIIQYLDNMYGEGSTFALRTSVYDYNAHITKMEVNPFDVSEDSIFDICEWLDRDTFILVHPIIFSDDIVQWFEYFDLVEVKYKQDVPDLSFQNIMRNDQIHAYPETSFDAYLKLLTDAADNIFVQSIKILLYRVGKDSRLIDTLCRAASNGKFVHVNLEMEAFGEKINQKWKERLEEAGVYVTTYHRGELKVHAKTSLITFTNGERIAQIGTGNYNPETTIQYTDLSYYTSNPNLCDEIEKLFQMLGGKEDQVFDSEYFLVTRQNCKEVLLQKIQEESWKKKDGYICIKCNAMNDPDIISALKYAERAGCTMDIIVRGLNQFYPNQSSDRRIRQISFVWDKLEHSRVYCFGKYDPTVYIGSLDLVKNKMENRVEVLVMVNDLTPYQYIIDYLNRYITDTMVAWKRVLGGSNLFVQNDHKFLNLVKEYGQHMFDYV